MTKEKDRKLTPAEQKRMEAFALICRQMEDDGYLRQDCTIGIVKANIYALLLMTPFAILSLAVFILTFAKGEAVFTPAEPLLFLVLYLVLVVFHEGIHGLTWAVFAKSHFKAIGFGVIWKYLTPYCTCSEALAKPHYILGGAMPTLVLGFGLSILSCCLQSPMLQALAISMIYGGGGDALIVLKLLRFKTAGKKVLFFDHPSECGFVAFVKLDTAGL